MKRILLLLVAGIACRLLAEDFSISSARRIFEGTLNDTLRFWTAPEVIDPSGGYHTWFDADGKKIAPNPSNPNASEAGKPLLVQLRVLYAHAVAIPRTEDAAERSRLRRQYEHGFAFLERYREPKTGLFVTSLNEQNRPHDASVRAVTQIYMIYIMSEIASEICDHRAVELAQDTFQKFDRIFHDRQFGGYFEYPAGRSPNRSVVPGWKSVGSNMHCALGFAKMLKVHPSGSVRQRLAELFRILTSDRILHPSGNGYMSMNARWEPVNTDQVPDDKKVLYGHNAELVWYLLEAGKVLRVPAQAMIPWMKKVADGVIRNGMTEDGVAAIFGPYEGKSKDCTSVRWWTQIELMNMLLKLYEVTGEQKYYDLFATVSRCSYRYLPSPSGVWYGAVDLDSGKKYYQGGWSWKAGLHIIRSMRLMNDVLDQCKEAWQPPRKFQTKFPKRAIQVSLGFPYNHKRSAESLVSELKVNGYDSVYLIIKSKELQPEGIVEAARKAGMQVWGSFFGPGTFMPDSLFGKESVNWRMQFTVKRQKRYFSYVHPEYRAWWKRFLGDLYSKHPFHGFVFYESYYGTRAGIMAAGKEPWFGDISPGFVRHFQQTTGHDRFPNFTDPASEDYYLTNRVLYQDYVDYRVKSVVDFHREIWDGEGGLRRNHPEVVFGTWTIALAGDEAAMKEMREYEAQDGIRMVAELQPDFHFLQSHWPDWRPKDQTPKYLNGYLPYIRSIREVYPNLTMAVQGDFASTVDYRRSPEWVAAFEKQARQTGFQFQTFYEFSVRHQVYFSAPRVAGGEWLADGSAKVIFDQVISEASAQHLLGKELGGGRKITSVKTDGNWLLLQIDGSGRAPVQIPLAGISDDPEIRVSMPGGKGKANPIPAGTTISLRQKQQADKGRQK